MSWRGREKKGESEKSRGWGGKGEERGSREGEGRRERKGESEGGSALVWPKHSRHMNSSR